MTFTYEELLPSVTLGAEWFDQVHPGWERAIDLATLDLENPCLCVLGQVVGQTTQFRPVMTLNVNGYVATYYALWSPPGSEEVYGFARVNHWMVEHGFQPSVRGGDKASWQNLNQAWIDLLKERFDTGNLSDSEIW